MNDPVRVLHLVRSMRVGGLENVVLNLCRGLAGHGIESHVGCLIEEGEWAERADASGRWVGGLQQAGRLHSVLAFQTLVSLCVYIKRNAISIVHTHNSHPHKYGVGAHILTGVPVVHTKHGRNWPDNPRWVWLSRQLSRCTAAIVPVSSDIERIVTDVERVPYGKVRTILNGVDVERFTPLPSGARSQCENSRETPGTAGCARRGAVADVRRTLGLPPDAFVIGSVGRYSPEKQYPALVHAFARFCGNRDNALLVLVGDGPARNQIRDAVRQSGLTESVFLTGLQDNIQEWLRAMDVFCLSSDQEGTSITLLEAGASGLPAVVTDVGGNGEVVRNGETGLVVPAGDERALTDAFQTLAADGRLRDRMGRAARDRIVNCYSLDHAIRRYVEVYREACRGGGPAAGERKHGRHGHPRR